MKDIKNATMRPLRVPLPNKKVLHLGPNGSGQVAVAALEHPPFVKLVESGEIEVLGEGHRQLGHPTKESASPAGSRGHGGAPALRSSGDR